MAKPLKIGVVGAGSIGIRAALNHLVLTDVQDRVIMTAVCDPAPGRAKAAAEKYNIPAWYEDYNEMLAQSDVQAITLCTPIGMHYEQGMQAIKSGRHVHFNKTMTTTTAEADHLIEEAKQRNIKITASPGEMLRPHNRRIREIVQEGTLGKLAWGITGACFGNYHEHEEVRQGESPLTNVDPTWYWSKKAGGGPLYDMTVYGLHILTGVLGPASRVSAFSGVGIKERQFRGRTFASDAHDNTLIILDFGDSLYSFVYGTFAGNITDFATVSLFGSQGTLVGKDLNGKPFDYPGREEAMAAKYGNQVLLPHIKGAHRELEESHVFEDIMQLVDLVNEGIPTPSNPEHARHVIEIIEGAYTSAETGSTQNLHTTFEMM